LDDLLELTSRAEATHFWFRGFRRYLSPVIEEFASGRTNLRLLDCGCGTGHNLRLLSPYGRAVGFDLTRRGSAAAHASGWPVVTADITSIPFGSNVFDIVTSFDVLQCVSADDAALREMVRVVRPGGIVVATLAAHEFLRGDHAEVWKEVRRYTRSSARRVFEQAGLRVERISYMFASTLPIMLVVRMGQRLMRPYRELRADTDIAVPSAPVNAVLSAMVMGEAALAQHLAMPVGSSLVVVGRKPN
jgi:ubiquinone/menaquinone biosynthesis C-methylase UbiE